MKLFFRRLAIYFKNHVDIVPFLFSVAALIIFTFGIYTFSQLNSLLVVPRYPWDQKYEAARAPLEMFQFFACLCSMLGVVAFLNYRSSKKNIMAIVFYVFSVIQLVNDVYYISEIYRHIGGVQQTLDATKIYYLANSEYIESGIIYSYLHLIVLSLSVILLLISPVIQKYTKRIKLKSVSNQDRDIDVKEDEVILDNEETSGKNQYGYSLDEIDDEFINDVINK